LGDTGGRERFVFSQVSSKVPFSATRYRRKTFRQRLTAPVFALALVGYFGFHALNGELGLVGKARIEHRYAELEKELTHLTAEREELQRRVMLLRPESLDPDMIDERARESLNLVQPQELAILRPRPRN
jgi:cell division protein FtsB